MRPETDDSTHKNSSTSILVFKFYQSRTIFYIAAYYKGGKRGEPRAPEGNVIKADDNLPDVKHRSTKGKGWKPGRLLLEGEAGILFLPHEIRTG